MASLLGRPNMEVLVSYGRVSVCYEVDCDFAWLDPLWLVDDIESLESDGFKV